MEIKIRCASISDSQEIPVTSVGESALGRHDDAVSQPLNGRSRPPRVKLDQPLRFLASGICYVKYLLFNNIPFIAKTLGNFVFFPQQSLEKRSIGLWEWCFFIAPLEFIGNFMAATEGGHSPCRAFRVNGSHLQDCVGRV